MYSWKMIGDERQTGTWCAHTAREVLVYICTRVLKVTSGTALAAYRVIKHLIAVFAVAPLHLECGSFPPVQYVVCIRCLYSVTMLLCIRFIHKAFRVAS